MTDFQSIAQQFTEFYYSTFDENRSNLAALYDLPFQKVKHAVKTLDAQPSSGEGGIIVMVTGALM
ncbi:MAG: hypothetical protein Q9180_008031, partial [Flavoplaca navasiana]